MKRQIVAVLVAGGVLSATLTLDAFERLTDEQCLSLMRRLETDKSIYVGPAERECLTRKIDPQKPATEEASMKIASSAPGPTVAATSPPAVGSATPSLEASGSSPQPPAPSVSGTPGPTVAATSPPAVGDTAPSSTGSGVVANISRGFLSKELAAFLEKQGWKALPGWWEASRDYQVIEPYVVEGETMEEVLGKILLRYRLKARLYKWDKSVRVYDAKQDVM